MADIVEMKLHKETVSDTLNGLLTDKDIEKWEGVIVIICNRDATEVDMRINGLNALETMGVFDVVKEQLIAEMGY